MWKDKLLYKALDKDFTVEDSMMKFDRETVLPLR